ncbi:MAG: sugar phosphate isomerase/epimerase [Ruminococcaceae bacterium]|nr:sugar phosphate isomerase/epimerase [Oscillospiraceae bacterium]
MAEFLISAFADEAASELSGQIAALQRNGLKWVELRAVNGSSLLKMSNEEIEEIYEELKAAGIGVSSYGSPIGKYPITEDFEPHLKDFRRALEVCKLLHTHRMRMFSFQADKEVLHANRDEVIRRLSVMQKEASAAGILLCHENEKKIYGELPAEAADVLGSVPGLRGIFDASNCLEAGGTASEGFAATRPYLEYLHIKDHDADPAGRVVPAGEGAGCLPEILREVNASVDGEFFLSVEPHLTSWIPERFPDKNAAFDAAVNALKTLLAKL